MKRAHKNAKGKGAQRRSSRGVGRKPPRAGGTVKVEKSLKAPPSPLEVWQRQRDKISRAMETVSNAPTMHGQAWKDGQLRYFQKLLDTLDASKPA